MPCLDHAQDAKGSDLHIDIAAQDDIEEGLVILPRLHTLLQAGLGDGIQMPKVHLLQQCSAAGLSELSHSEGILPS